MKIFFVVLDGLGDEPIPAFDNKTPLEAANTPNLDSLAQKGLVGLLKPYFRGVIPTSEEGHSLLFGYDINEYPLRRGIFEAMGLNLSLKKEDIVLRGNFVIVDDDWNILDRRAGRIEKTEPLVKALSQIKIKGVEIKVEKGAEHRFVLVLKGKNLSWQVTDSDPFYQNLGNKIQKVKGDKFTASILNEFSQKAFEVLKDYPANHVILRGASCFSDIPSFEKKHGLKAACVANKPLYRGIGKILGMKVIKAGNLKKKFKKAKKAWKKNDFVYLHIKKTDSLAEDGNYLEKKKYIEKIDSFFDFQLKDTLLVVTSDHSTCSLLKRHCVNDIPFLIHPFEGSFKEFSEKEGKKGKTMDQIDFMSFLLRL